MQPKPSQTARGHEEPFALQFSVFMPNRVGQFCELLDTFDKNNIELVGISVVDSTDWAVIRMVCTDPNHTREVLMLRSHDNPVMVFNVDDNVTATEILSRHNFILLGSEDIFDLGGMADN